MINKIKIYIKENYKFILGLCLLIFICTFEFPYKINTPGGLANLNDRISVEGGYSQKGSFNMTYVSMKYGTIPNILLSFVIPDWDLVNDKELTLENEDFDTRMKIDKMMGESSVDEAIMASFKAAEKELVITEEKIYVSYILKEADTNLLPMDQIIKVNDTFVSSKEDLLKYVDELKVDDRINFTVIRNGKEEQCYGVVKLIMDKPKVGFTFISKYLYKESPSANIKMNDSEYGSSGGLMMALSIYNALVPEDLTKGNVIAGTGTINKDGEVGEIDGVKYKLLGASRKKAKLFLVPNDNYDEAIDIKNKYHLTIDIKNVATLEDAINYLKNYE